MLHKTLCIFFLLVSAIFSSIAQPTNTNISNGIIFDGEPYLAQNPSNPKHLVAAWMGTKLNSGQYKITIKTRVGLDGGINWSAANALPHLAVGFGSADVSMAFDKNGLLYLCYIDYKQSPDSGGIYVSRSIDGGLNWDNPSKAFDINDDPIKKPIDRPWLVVDKSTTSNQETLYITSKPPSWVAAPNRNYYKVSVDSGHTWSTLKNVDGGAFLIGSQIDAPMAAPATTSNGLFIAAYPSYVTSQNVLPAFYLALSKDKGQTVSYKTILAAIPGSSDANFKKGYQLIAHPTDSNKLVFFTPDAINGDLDITALHSNDGGQTWSSRVRVNDDSIGNGKAQDLVWGAYNNKGKLAVTWRDRRSANGNGFWNNGYDFYYATSNDNGATFSVNKKLSSQFIAFDSLTAENGNDFMSCTFYEDTLYTVWGDTRTGRMNIFFAKTIVSTNTPIGINILNELETNWSFSPNPITTNLKLHLDATLFQTSLQIFDVNGKVVHSTQITQKEMAINVGDLEQGIYFIKIGNTTKPFLKSNH